MGGAARQPEGGGCLFAGDCVATDCVDGEIQQFTFLQPMVAETKIPPPMGSLIRLHSHGREKFTDVIMCVF